MHLHAVSSIPKRDDVLWLGTLTAGPRMISENSGRGVKRPWILPHLRGPRLEPARLHSRDISSKWDLIDVLGTCSHACSSRLQINTSIVAGWGPLPAQRAIKGLACTGAATELGYFV